MISFVFDFETMGTDPDAVVLSCALTMFDSSTKLSFDEYIADTYYWKFDIEEQLTKYKRTISQETLDWWDKKDPDVKRSQFTPTEKDITLEEFIAEFKYALEENNCDKNTLGYCRGQSFDFPIMASIVRSVAKIDNVKVNPAFFPIPFWNQRDIRTYIAGLFCDPSVTKCPTPKGTLDGFKHHDPIHDNARAIIMMKWAELYAMEDIPIPDKDNIDPNSLK
jgi:hypothetical protein